MPHHFVLLDLEFNGLDVEKHQPIEVVAYRCDKFVNTLDTFESVIGPPSGQPFDHFIKASDPRSLEKCGISFDELRYAKPLDQVMSKFFKWLPTTYTFIGYSLDLDLKFLQKCSDSYGSRKLSYRSIDLAGLVEYTRALKGLDLERSWSLSASCEFFGLSCKKAHRARYDVEMVKSLFLKLREIHRCS